MLGESLGVCGGAAVLHGEAVPRLAGASWGEYQDPLLQLGRELVDGIEADSAPTARATILPSSSTAERIEGVLLAAPIRGLQQALGVMVLLDRSEVRSDVDQVLSLLNAVGIYLGFHLQTASLQERLKALPEPAAAVRNV
jgi:GAF domain-containing protein